METIAQSSLKAILFSGFAVLLIASSAATLADNATSTAGAGISAAPEHLAYEGAHRPPYYRHIQKQHHEKEREKADFMRFEERKSGQDVSGEKRWRSNDYRYPPGNLRGR